MVLRACNPSVDIPVKFVSGIAGRGVRTKARFSTNTARSTVSTANMPSNDWRPIRSDLRRRPGRKPRYDKELLPPVRKRVWLTSNQMCSKRLRAELPQWLPQLAPLDR
jgi:hypothetical protein